MVSSLSTAPNCGVSHASFSKDLAGLVGSELMECRVAFAVSAGFFRSVLQRVAVRRTEVVS